MAYEGDIIRTLQIVRVTDTNSTSVTTTIPVDTSIPQISEGQQLFSQSFTPISATSSIELTVYTTVQANTEQGTMAFFDGNTNAIFASQIAQASANLLGATVFVQTVVTSGSTTARTYSVRVGRAGSNTLSINGGNYGGTSISEFIIREYE